MGFHCPGCHLLLSYPTPHHLIPPHPQPGSKGMALQAAGWAALTAAMLQLSAGLEARDESVWVDLGGNKRASVSGYKGELEGGLQSHAGVGKPPG